MDTEQIERIKTALGLSYHIDYALAAEQMVGLRGKRVLEVGGCLPPAFVLDVLGVHQWVGIQELGWFHEFRAAEQHTGVEQVVDITELAEADRLGRYAVLLGGVEDLPACLHGRFDVVFSIAAFEHVLRFGLALERMAAALAPGGRLFSMFSPVWSAHDGHHLPEITDAAGRAFSFGNSPIPPWGHLLLRPPQLYAHLLRHTDARAAAEMVYYVYHSPHLNRLFVEDYAAYVEASPLRGHIGKTFKRPLPPELQARLEALHPGRRHFDNNGLRMILHRRDEPQ